MEQNILEKILQGSMEPKDLPLELLREITAGFSEDRIIGEGGFEKVYKGIVGNRNVAVKRMRSNMTIDDKLFRREVNSLMEVNHQNVVRFLGLCSHTTETPMKNPKSRGYIFVEIRERLLCFEYISNGSLDKQITDELRGLEWDTRYKIIKGICTGLHYLHTEKCILHMDLKPANILLDNDMLPKITDFGLSRYGENSQTDSRNHFLTLGYCAPENVFGCGRMSVQSDIYSLGVIIIELVTGNKGIPDTTENILRRWWHRWNKSEKETSLKYHEQVTKCIEIGSLCQKYDPYARPSISEIMTKFVELESMGNCRMIAHDSATGQIKPSYWEDDMLRVEPLELHFANSGNDKQLILSCSVELSNDTNSSIAFNIQTTSPLPYSIEPNKDIVKPQTKCSVEITLPAANTQDHNNKKYITKFIVKSIKLNEGLTTNDLNKEVFDTHISGQHVDEIYLSVIYKEPCDEEVMVSPTNQAQCTSSEARPTPIKPGRVQLVIKNDSTVAPLLEHKKKVMLHLTGGDYTSDRPGLDLVVVVDVSHNMKGWKNGQLKTAMQFLVGKLSPMDRLSIITSSNNDVEELWPLRQIIEASQRELDDLISQIYPSGFHYTSEGLQAGLNVLADREVHAGRVAAIMFVTSSGRALHDYYGPVDFGDVPVYTFYFDNEYSDPTFPAQVAAKSMGGTFSHVMQQDTGGLTMAFSQCLAGLLSVAVQNLELTVAAVGGESKIVKVRAGSYPQEKQNENGSVSVKFGNLYSREVRKVIVELLLPTFDSEHSAEILHVTYSHDSSPGMMKFVATAETLTVCRTGTGVKLPKEEKNPTWLLSEEARLQMIKKAPMSKLLEAQNMPELQKFSKLRSQLQELAKRSKEAAGTSTNKLDPIALSWVSCHDRQRLAWTGMRLFATPRMDKYMQQARKFLNEPTMPLSSVDDDVKEEMGAALTVDVAIATREKQMRELALDVVRLRPRRPTSPPPPVTKSGGLFRMFRKKRSGGS